MSISSPLLSSYSLPLSYIILYATIKIIPTSTDTFHNIMTLPFSPSPIFSSLPPLSSPTSLSLSFSLLLSFSSHSPLLLQKINEIKEQDKNENLKLRVAVDSGGCSGYKYAWNMEEEDVDPEED